VIETFLSIASFSTSFGGLVAVLGLKEGPIKKIVLAVVVAVLLVTSGTMLYVFCRHERCVDRVKLRMINILVPEKMTVDDLYQSIFPPVSHELLMEALYDAVEEGAIGYEPLKLQSKGKTMSVKVFYAR
jgi:hypothetical protein